MGSSSKWRKAKLALGLNMCLYVPEAQDQDLSPSSSSTPSSYSTTTHPILSDAVSLSPAGQAPPSPTSPCSSKRTCAICLTTIKPGHGHAIFTAECSHSFHFHCITSNVKHGNQICPVCRAKWKEVPFQNPASDLSPGRSRINGVGWSQDDAWLSILRQLHSPQLDVSRQVTSVFHAPEPAIFNDDEVLDHQDEVTENSNASSAHTAEHHSIGTIGVLTYPEVSAVPSAVPHNNFAILIHLKAPSGRHNSSQNQMSVAENSRAPVDLVTVLDVSGSMVGTKLALLKQAVGFVIQNLGPSDRLSVIAFSSNARRLFPFRRMTETGRQEALQAVNSLLSSGGTNIAEGLKKGAKVLLERQWTNPVGSIILLSDGQDTYNVTSAGGANSRTDYKSLLPVSVHLNGGTGYQLPVHVFGFGADHDAASMHSISEISGGTFSFIEAEGVIQDAFARCIGGLLNVVAQTVRVKIECVHPSLQITSIKAGSYQTNLIADGRTGFIDVGDLYAEEERDFLVTVDIPANVSSEEMSLLKVRCSFSDPISKEVVISGEPSEVKIQRPAMTEKPVVSVEVDRQRNRLRAAEAMAEAQAAAERGDLSNAASVLESCRRALSETASSQACEKLYVALCAELKEMQERMASRRIYESSGRAYVLSGLSSHSWQRATTRGDSTESTSLVQAYQTPAMVDMVTRSQTMISRNPPSQRKLRQAQSFPARPHPR